MCHFQNVFIWSKGTYLLHFHKYFHEKPSAHKARYSVTFPEFFFKLSVVLVFPVGEKRFSSFMGIPSAIIRHCKFVEIFTIVPFCIFKKLDFLNLERGADSIRSSFSLHPWSVEKLLLVIGDYLVPIHMLLVKISEIAVVDYY